MNWIGHHPRDRGFYGMIQFHHLSHGIGIPKIAGSPGLGQYHGVRSAEGGFGGTPEPFVVQNLKQFGFDQGCAFVLKKSHGNRLTRSINIHRQRPVLDQKRRLLYLGVPLAQGLRHGQRGLGIVLHRAIVEVQIRHDAVRAVEFRMVPIRAEVVGDE